ncbi:MAG: Holliday junction branch migration protein RuvA [Patescibacteria group bacterium]|nr:Holliday junction branch migration protein RuvA [Patescibacteria group bacterium]
MIAQLQGNIVHRDEKGVILGVGGVGYHVFLSTEGLRTLPKTADSVSLWTYLAVRENALDLYGFVEKKEHDFFGLLLGVSGIGPKSALAILSLAPPATIQKAVSSSDSSYLTKVSGIGKKSAEKIVLELKDKLDGLGTEHTDNESGDITDETEALEALQALGYNLRQAREALRDVPTDIKTEEKLKLALKNLK